MNVCYSADEENASRIFSLVISLILDVFFLSSGYTPGSDIGNFGFENSPSGASREGPDAAPILKYGPEDQHLGVEVGQGHHLVSKMCIFV